MIEGAQARCDLLPGRRGAGLAARAGYPIIIVPFGIVPNAPTPPFPAGFDAQAGALSVWALPARRAANRD